MNNIANIVHTLSSYDKYVPEFERYIKSNQEIVTNKNVIYGMAVEAAMIETAKEGMGITVIDATLKALKPSSAIVAGFYINEEGERDHGKALIFKAFNALKK